MARNLLHKTKFELFKSWLKHKGIPYRDGKGVYQMLQVQSKCGKFWYVIYERNHMPEHYTVVKELEPLVRRFIGNCKGH